MSTEVREVVKQFVFQVNGLGPVKAIIYKQIHPELPQPYRWQTNYSCSAYEPRNGAFYLDGTQEDLFEYIESFDAPSAVRDEYF